MTTHDKDKIIAAANQCFIESNLVTLVQLERFYTIAFEAGCQSEREACAVVCDCYTVDDDRKNDDARRCAKAIRARGKGK